MSLNPLLKVLEDQRPTFEVFFQNLKVDTLFKKQISFFLAFDASIFPNSQLTLSSNPPIYLFYTAHFAWLALGYLSFSIIKTTTLDEGPNISWA